MGERIQKDVDRIFTTLNVTEILRPIREAKKVPDPNEVHFSSFQEL